MLCLGLGLYLARERALGCDPPIPTWFLSLLQLDNLVLINKIKEQLMAEKIRPPHLPPTSASSQQPLLVPPAPAESSQAVMSLPKLQQVPGLHPQSVPQPDVALHARPATSTVTGLGLSSRTPAVSTSESTPGTGTGTSTPSTPTTTKPNPRTPPLRTQPKLPFPLWPQARSRLQAPTPFSLFCSSQQHLGCQSLKTR